MKNTLETMVKDLKWFPENHYCNWLDFELIEVLPLPKKVEYTLKIDTKNRKISNRIALLQEEKVLFHYFLFMPLISQLP